jgi:NADPH:quinone reductase-like Zn-dependent oxidoreductase
VKAIIHTVYGPPDVLELKDLDKPLPGDSEILVRVHAATVNRTDCAMLRARPFIMRFMTGLFKPKNPVPGTDFAGRIEAIGKDVSKFNVGDDVFGFDDNGVGSHAGYMTYSQDNAVAVMPENITYEQAAASIEGAHYAINFINKVRLNAGDRVLVNGATGAIGSAAVQLLKYYGAHVTATCKTEKIELIKSIGADEVIDYTEEDFTKSDKTFNFVFDTVGKSTFSECKPLLKADGVYISSELGSWIQNVYYSLVTPLTGKLPQNEGRKVRFPYPQNRLESVRFISKLMEEGRFEPVIDRKYKLEDAAEAFNYVETGEKTGNVVLTFNSDIVTQ